jgi:hypothetical protein
VFLTESNAFVGYKIIWPGTRLPPEVTSKSIEELEDLVSEGTVVIDWSHVYFLEKKIPLRYDGTKINSTTSLMATEDRYHYLTALRLQTGEFIVHPQWLLKYTMNYAHRDTIPIR